MEHVGVARKLFSHFRVVCQLSVWEIVFGDSLACDLLFSLYKLAQAKP